MTSIWFDKDHKVEVEESPEEIREQLTGLGPVITPILRLKMRLTDIPVYVGASQIREIR